MKKRKAKGKKSIQFRPSRTEIRRRMGICDGTLLRWLSEHNMPHTKDGDVIVVDIDELKKWVEAREEKKYNKELLPRYSPTIDEICKHFKIRRQTLHRWMRIGMPFETTQYENTKGEKREMRVVDLESVRKWRKTYYESLHEI